MGFFDIDRWDEIWQTIARNRKRSIMTAMGIFWGIFMLTVMLGAGTGLGNLSRTGLGDLATNTMYFFPQQTSVSYRGMPLNRYWQIDEEDVEAVRALPEVIYATQMIFCPTLNCAYGEHTGSYQLSGYTPEMQKIQPQPMLYGRYINDIDMMQRRKVCVIGTQVWKDLFPGGEDPTGKIIKVGPFYFTVIGVIVKKGEINFGGGVERNILFPSSLARQLFSREGTFTILGLSGRDDLAPSVVDKAARNVVLARHIISPDDQKAIWTLSMGEMVANVTRLFRGIALLTWVVGLGTLFAGIVGVSNIMLVLVKERTQEIGIRRALGAKPSAIISQILSESFILTFIAGVMGLAAGVGVLSLGDSIFYQAVTVANNGPEVSFQISFGLGMLSLVILVAGSLLAGVIPAYRALKIKAVDAIREE